MSRPLPGLVIISVEGDVDGAARRIVKLRQVSGAQMCAYGTGGIAKAGLPKHGQVEQPFDQDHGRKTADGLPGKQPAFGARQQTVRKRRADTAAVEVDDCLLYTSDAADE